jgi:hypothetical protein
MIDRTLCTHDRKRIRWIPSLTSALHSLHGGAKPRDKLGCADSMGCNNPTTHTKKGAVQFEPPPKKDVASKMPLLIILHDRKNAQTSQKSPSPENVLQCFRSSR